MEMILPLISTFGSHDISTCGERWRLMKEKYHIDEEEDSWLVKMYRLRTHWVNTYPKDIFLCRNDN